VVLCCSILYNEGMNKTFILLLGIVVLAAGAIWFFTHNKTADVSDVTAFATSSAVTFTSADGTENLSASFAGEQVLVNGQGMERVVLRQVVAASGARYENADGSIVLWNKGNEVTLYQNGAQTFVGTDLSAPVVESEVATTATPQALTATTWIWSKTTTGTDVVTTPVQTEAFTLTFSPEGRVTGTTDCNNFSGNYILAGDQLAMESFGMTKMACPDSQEMDFIGAITGTTTVVFTTTGGLSLVQADGAVTVDFAPTLITSSDGGAEDEATDDADSVDTDAVAEPTVDITSGVWLWQEANVAGQTVRPLKPGVFSLTFDAAGSVAIGTDCNNMGGQYTYSGGVLTFSQIISTMMACDGSQESAFAALLNEPLKVMFPDTTTMVLTLPDAAGTATFTRK
jgi:heat shock protein HslJ